MAELLCIFFCNSIAAEMFSLYLWLSWNKESLFQFMPVFTQTCFKFRWKKIKWVLSKDPVRVDISFLTHEISGRQGMEDASYCICDLGTEDIIRGRASYSLERDEEGDVFNLVFNVNADLLWFFFLFCLGMIELFMFLRLQNEKCLLLLKVSCAEVFSLYSFYIFLRKKKNRTKH